MDAVEKLYARCVDLERENEHLYACLGIARGALRQAKVRFSEAATPQAGMALAMDDALRRSDPDAETDSVS